MSNYNLLVPSVRSFLFHIGALPTAAGLVIGCCDLASMPSTVGETPDRQRRVNIEVCPEPESESKADSDPPGI